MISRILKLIITIEIVMCVRGKNTSAPAGVLRVIRVVTNTQYITVHLIILGKLLPARNQLKMYTLCRRGDPKVCGGCCKRVI